MKYPPIEPWADPGEPGVERLATVPSAGGPSLHRGVRVRARFFAVRSRYAMDAGLRFDTRFEFHFYDLDFCRGARKLGLSVGTWPIDLTHQSGGAYGSPSWHAGHARYMDKWGH